MSKIVPFHSNASAHREIGHYVRLGDTGHKILEDLVAEGRFPVQRVVVDASSHLQQAQLIEALSAYQAGVELVLDTKCAELAEPGKYRGVVRKAPWSQHGAGQPLVGDQFPTDRPSKVLQQIAEFAIEHNYSAVLGTGHYLQHGSKSNWLELDIQACIRLVELLDRLGAAHIGVDYSLVVPHTLLSDHQECAKIIDRLQGVPFQNLWIRASGFGADAKPLTTQRYLRSLTQFHQLQKPVIADYLGGLVGYACAAFGAVSGISQGIGERQRFDAKPWLNPPPPPKESFGRAVRMSIPGVQTSLTKQEISTVAATPAGRRLVACRDRNCCENGLTTMLENPRRHAIKQTTSAFERMEKIPVANRPRDFLGGMFEEELRTASELARLRLNDQKLSKRLKANGQTLGRLFSTLENLLIERENSGLQPRQVPKRAFPARATESKKQ
ncbi:MAG: hypothetical protein AAF749_06475 [Pseudomonadota bacterium]